jgi:hypothetical protein
MARIRSVKPEFWTSEQVMRLSIPARLAFIGMWNYCDDAGNIPASNMGLKAKLFPSDTLETTSMQGWTGELLREGLIAEYEAAGHAFWHVTGWWRHQRIEKPQPPKYPPFPEDYRSPTGPFPENYRSGTGTFPVGEDEDGNGWDGSGWDGNGIDKKRKRVETPPRAPRGSRLPDDWVLSDELRAWTTRERPDIDAERTADEFRDYWTAKPGKDGLKLDWTKTWRNWVRNERGHYARNGRAGPTPETPYAKHMREQYEQLAPNVAAKAPAKRSVIDVEAKNVIVPGRMG